MKTFLHIMLFLALLITPLFATLIEASTFSLHSFPNQFTGRHSLIQLYSSIVVHLLGDTPRDSLILGHKGWFFRGKGKQRLANNKVDEYNYLTQDTRPFTETDFQRWKTVLEERQAFLQHHGSSYLFFIAPKKSLIYPEYLPDSLRKRQEQNSPTFVEQLLEFLDKESNVPVVDLVSILREEKKRRPDQLLYLKTDGHWNPLGAFVAYQAVTRKIQEILPEKNISPLRLEDFTIRWKNNWAHAGFTNQLGIAIEEPFPRLLPNRTNPIASALLTGKRIQKGIPTPYKNFWATPLLQTHNKRQLTAKLIDNRGIIQQYSVALNTEGRPFQNILLLGDSFLMKMFSFFSAHTKTLLRQRSERDFPIHYFSTDSPIPEIVIQEVSQRYLGVHAPEESLIH